jgi:predicted lactoylglutathione lyase
MNERIRLLAEQAFNQANDGTIADIKIPKEFIERFAELIVEECARDFDKTYMAGGETMGTYIRQKFGVES